MENNGKSVRSLKSKIEKFEKNVSSVFQKSARYSNEIEILKDKLKKVCKHKTVRYTMPGGDDLGYDSDLVECIVCEEEGRDYEFPNSRKI